MLTPMLTKVRDMADVVLHKDGTVTHWAVFEQQWMERVRAVSDRELAAMAPETREKVKRHLARHSAR